MTHIRTALPVAGSKESGSGNGSRVGGVHLYADFARRKKKGGGRGGVKAQEGKERAMV